MLQGHSISVSVVVPCRNEIRHIRAFLDSVLGQELGEIEMEILIADGMSRDGTRQVLDEYEVKFPALRVLDNPGKIVSTGLNRAIREAKGEIIIRMDAHTTYASDYVRSCVEVLQETHADNVGGPPLTHADGYIAQAIALGFHTPFASGGAKYRDPGYEGPVELVPFGCWRKSTLERVGLFDETLVRGQDCDLNARLLSCGGIMWQSPRIINWYRPRATLGSLFRQYFQYGFWKVAVVRKMGRHATFRNLVPGTCFLAGVALLVCAWTANLAGLFWWRNVFLTDFSSLAALYFILSFAQTFYLAKREGWQFLPILPIVFATYHLSYALGFVLALMHRPLVSEPSNPIQKLIAAITR